MSALTQFIKKIIPREMYSKYIARSRNHLSQFGQDFWVFGEVFNGQRDGYFVEIGSADGITINNTYLLESKYKWKGICIEASPSAYEALKNNRKAICLNICLDTKEGIIEFYEDGLTSGIIDNDTDNSADTIRKDRKVVQLQTRTLGNVLSENNAPNIIDYLSIDVEGAEERILRTFPFEIYRFNSITIERPSELLRNVLSKNGYVIIKEIPGADTFYLHSGFLNEYSDNMNRYWKDNRK